MLQIQSLPIAQCLFIRADGNLSCCQGSFDTVGGHWFVFSPLGAPAAAVGLGLWARAGFVPRVFITAGRRVSAALAPQHFLAFKFFFHWGRKNYFCYGFYWLFWKVLFQILMLVVFLCTVFRNKESPSYLYSLSWRIVSSGCFLKLDWKISCCAEGKGELIHCPH